MYYSFHDLLSYNCLFNFIVGNRGAGKTYGAKKLAIKKFLKDGSQFIYLRRYKTEFDDFKNFFADIQHEFPDHTLETKGKSILIDGQLAGYGISLSTALTKKSVSYHLVKTIIFDEFVIDSKIIRYLSNEVGTFLEFYETVARMRDDVRVLFLSNAVSIVNPYFLYWNMKPKAGKRFTKFGHMMVEFVKNEEFINAKYKTKFGQIIQGTKYGNYAVENVFLKDNDNFVESKPGNSKFQFSIEYGGHKYGFWTTKDGLIYASSDIDPSFKLEYVVGIENHKPSMILVTSLNRHKWMKISHTAFENGYMRFENMQIKNQIIEMFNYLRA
jgi:hypothetical protein